jgi:hypothetical protein
MIHVILFDMASRVLAEMDVPDLTAAIAWAEDLDNHLCTCFRVTEGDVDTDYLYDFDETTGKNIWLKAEYGND